MFETSQTNFILVICCIFRWNMTINIRKCWIRVCSGLWGIKISSKQNLRNFISWISPCISMVNLLSFLNLLLFAIIVVKYVLILTAHCCMCSKMSLGWCPLKSRNMNHLGTDIYQFGTNMYLYGIILYAQRYIF